jgi:hypothetical protein
MATLHIENQVRDYDSWKAVFDKFEQFRAEGGVRSYRVSRHVGDPNRVDVDLDFDNAADAQAFGQALEKIWATPQSQQQLLSHSVPRLLDPVEMRTIAPASV